MTWHRTAALSALALQTLLIAASSRAEPLPEAPPAPASAEAPEPSPPEAATPPPAAPPAPAAAPAAAPAPAPAPAPAATWPFAAPPLLLVISGSRADAQYRIGYADPQQKLTYPPFAVCTGSCMIYVPPARYSIEVGGYDVAPGSRAFDVTRSSRVLVTPRTESERSSGLVLGVVGIVLVAGGALAILADQNSGDAYGSEGGVFFLGLGAFITGAILTPIGWVRYARRSPDVVVEPL